MDIRSFEAVLVRQCAPTLAGLKPGSMFSISTSEGTYQKVGQWNERLHSLELSVRILLKRPSSMIVYVYRKKHLEGILSDCGCQQFLAQAGYEKLDLDSALEHLTYRLQSQPEFPHEVGVFLGYPLRDVIGFIENRGQNFTCCGFWKSYSDPATIEACFDCYRRCIHTYMELFEQGVPIEELAVPA